MFDVITCKIFGVTHLLETTGVDFSKDPVTYNVSASSVLAMLSPVKVGAAYDSYTPYKTLKAGRADFKISKIEKVSENEWLYSFVDRIGRPFNTILKRRAYDYWSSESLRPKR